MEEAGLMFPCSPWALRTQPQLPLGSVLSLSRASVSLPAKQGMTSQCQAYVSHFWCPMTPVRIPTPPSLGTSYLSAPGLCFLICKMGTTELKGL